MIVFLSFFLSFFKDSCRLFSYIERGRSNRYGICYHISSTFSLWIQFDLIRSESYFTENTKNLWSSDCTVVKIKRGDEINGTDWYSPGNLFRLKTIYCSVFHAVLRWIYFLSYLVQKFNVFIFDALFFSFFLFISKLYYRVWSAFFSSFEK